MADKGKDVELIAVTPCFDHQAKVRHEVGHQFTVDEQQAKDFLEMGAAVKPDDKKAEALIANAHAIADKNAGAIAALHEIDANKTVTNPGNLV
jgi:hypothetical protein